jgi:DNA polymerase
MERVADPITPAEAQSLLAWWREAGVDLLIDETPRDWLRPVHAPTPEEHPSSRAI